MACILTPPGSGAVAVVRIWGPGSLEAADAAFRPMRGRRLAETPPRTPRLGRVGAGLGDEVVAVVLDGEPAGIEIQCHGGPAAVEMVIAALQEQGAQLVEPAEFAARLAPSSSSAAAWEDLAKAETLRTAEILLEQAHGALDREIAEIEAGHPGASSQLEALIDRARIGLRLINGWRVVIAGRPNAGKSRLLNALAGYDRAIVSPTPGTTRDAVTVRTAFDGWPVELVDTAGLRESEDLVERSGVERALLERARADLTLLVLDLSRPLEDDDLSISDGPTLIVASKADLPRAWEPANVLGDYSLRSKGEPPGAFPPREGRQTPKESDEAGPASEPGADAGEGRRRPSFAPSSSGPSGHLPPRGGEDVVRDTRHLPEQSLSGLAPFVVVSAETGAGLDDLTVAIARALVPHSPEPCCGVPFRLDQLEHLIAMKPR